MLSGGFWRRADKFPDIIPTVSKKYDGFTDTNGEVVMFKLDKIVDVYSVATGEESPLNSIGEVFTNARGYNPNRDEGTGMFTFGSKGESTGVLDRDMTQVDTSYRGSHGAPNREDEVSSPGHDLSGDRGTFPSDIYSERASRLYSSGYTALDKEAADVIQSMRGNKNKKSQCIPSCS